MINGQTERTALGIDHHALTDKETAGWPRSQRAPLCAVDVPELRDSPYVTGITGKRDPGLEMLARTQLEFLDSEETRTQHVLFMQRERKEIRAPKL